MLILTSVGLCNCLQKTDNFGAILCSRFKLLQGALLTPSLNLQSVKFFGKITGFDFNLRGGDEVSQETLAQTHQ